MKSQGIVFAFVFAFIITIGLFSFVSADLGTFKQGECVKIVVPLNAVSMTLTNVNSPSPNTSIILTNQAMEKNGNLFNYTFCDTLILGTYTYGFCDNNNQCYSNSFSITPNGNSIDDVGQLSASLIYFFVIMGVAFLFFGYLLVKNESLWVSYSGLFVMIVGFSFFYYDLHLANVYATTVAVNGGAGNVTTSTFLMFTRFIKLAPYLVAGIITYYTINVLRESINKKKSSDGWDNNKF